MRRFLDSLKQSDFKNMGTDEIKERLETTRAFVESVRPQFLSVEQSELLYRLMFLMQAELEARTQ